MKHPSENKSQEALAGLVERVTYHNSENGFCVLRAKARGHRDVVTVVGHAATIAAGEWITASGEWVNDRFEIFRVLRFFGLQGKTQSRPRVLEKLPVRTLKGRGGVHRIATRETLGTVSMIS